MTPSSHVHKGLGFHPGISCCKNMVTLNGALNRKSDAPRAPPPLPPTVEAYARNFTIPVIRSRLKTVEAYARNFTIPAARSRLKTVARCNHDASTRKSPASPETPPRTTSKHQTALDPTTKVVPDQHRRRRGAPPSCRKAVARTLQPVAASHSLPGPATARPPPVAASHNRSPAGRS
jgi:hypothetical protein